jgi:1,4-alpha-glucan branching enzyme
VGQGEAQAETAPVHGQPYSLALTLPPLATVIYLAEGA